MTKSEEERKREDSLSASLDAEGESTERDVVRMDDGTTNEGEGKIKGESDTGESEKKVESTQEDGGDQSPSSDDD